MRGDILVVLVQFACIAETIRDVASALKSIQSQHGLLAVSGKRLDILRQNFLFFLDVACCDVIKPKTIAGNANVFKRFMIHPFAVYIVRYAAIYPMPRRPSFEFALHVVMFSLRN